MPTDRRPDTARNGTKGEKELDRKEGRCDERIAQKKTQKRGEVFEGAREVLGQVSSSSEEKEKWEVRGETAGLECDTEGLRSIRRSKTY